MTYPIIVKTEGLKKIYIYDSQTVQVLHGINLTVTKGDFLAIAGPSGSGKTTLLNLIGCLDTPSNGKVFIEDEDVSVFSRRKLSKLRLEKIGFIFQEYNLIPVLTALENLEYVMLLQGWESEARRKKALTILHEVGMAGMENRRPNQMSGGQQQRVAVARAIVTEPVIVLADEPTANLDSQTGLSLLELMYSLNQTKGITFLFSTHDPMVMKRAKRIIFLKDGRVDREETK